MILRDLLNELPQDIREKAYIALKNQNKEKRLDKEGDIYSAFTFSETPEGSGFWSEAHEKHRKGLYKQCYEIF